MRRLLLGSLTALLLTLPLASSASAESVTRTDARGDVRYCDYTDESDDDPSDNCDAVVDRPTVDLTGYRITYGTARIQVVLQYAELEPTGPARFYAGVTLQYRDGARGRGFADLGVQTTPGNRAGTSSVVLADDRSCTTRHLVDYDRNRITLTVGSACLRNPRYVLASIGTFAASADYSRGYVDTAPGGFDGPTADATVRVDRR